MADSFHVTLVADTVSTVTINAPGRLEVINVTGTAAVYFTTNGVAPVIAANDTQVLPAAIGSMEVNSRQSLNGTTLVKLISAGTPSVSVRAVS